MAGSMKMMPKNSIECNNLIITTNYRLVKNITNLFLNVIIGRYYL